MKHEDDPSNRHITGCRIHTPKLVITIYQVGWGLA